MSEEVSENLGCGGPIESHIIVYDNTGGRETWVESSILGVVKACL